MTTLTLDEVLPPGICALCRALWDKPDLREISGVGLVATPEKSILEQLMEIGAFPERFPDLDHKAFDHTCYQAALMVTAPSAGTPIEN